MIMNSTNHSDDLDEDAEGEEDELIFENLRVQILLILVYTLVFVFCLLGNLTVVLVMSLHWKIRAVTKFCLVNLAFSNLCVGFFCVYQNLSLFLMDSWIFGSFLCKMYHYINSLSHTASILILVVVSVERYLVILHPLKCRSVLTVHRLRWIILGVWVASALLSSPRLFYIVTINNIMKGMGSSRMEVICALDTTAFNFEMADLSQFILLFVLPLIIISVLYAKIGLFLHQRAATFVSTMTSVSPSREESSHHSSRSCSVDFVKIRRQAKISQGNNSSSEKSNSFSSSSNENNPSRQEGQDAQESRVRRSREGLKSISVQTSVDEPGRGTSGKKVKKNHSTMIRINFSKKAENFSESPCGLFCPRAVVSSVTRPHAGAVRMLILIVLTFALCNFPYHLRKIYQNYFDTGTDSDSDWAELATPITFILMYANSAINPILYAFMSRSFRKSMVEFFNSQIRPLSKRNR